MGKQASRQVSIFLNGKSVENSIKSIAAEQKKVNNELAGMIRGTVEYEQKAAELRKINGILAEHRRGLSGIKEGWSLTKAGLDKFVGVAAAGFTVDKVIQYGTALFNTSSRMEAMERKAKILFQDALPGVTREAEENAAAMGLTTKEYISQAAAIQDILVPMGFQRKQAAAMSTELVNLSGALSEWTEGQLSAKDVGEILTDALTGEFESLKQLGIVLQQSDIDAELAAKGLSKLTGESRQQAEAAAALDLIMRKSGDAQTAYAENSDSLTRRSAELSAKFQDIYEKIATLLIPVFEGLLAIAEPVVDAIADVAGAVTDFFSDDDTKQAEAYGEALENNAAATKKFADEQLKAEAKRKELELQREKEAKQRAEQQKREAEQAQKDLLELTKRVAETRLDLLAKQQDDELAVTIRAIEKRYDAEIAKALELEKKGVEEATAQRIALEELKQQEIGLAVEENIQKAVAQAEKQAREEAEARAKVAKEAFDKDNEERLKYLEEKEAAEAEVKAFQQEALLSDRELELAALEDHYAELLAAAQKYGLDTTTLTEAYAAKKSEIEKSYAEKTAQEQYEIQQARFAALQSAFTAFGDFAVATFDLLGGEGEKAAAFQKVATLAKIAFDTAAAISSLVAASEANPANAVTFGAAAVAQYIAGITRILTNIAQAKKILSSAPAVQQKYTGSYLDVTGADDGRAYRARTIAAPATGLLPDYPVLFQSRATGAPVLASERGREYFVSADALRNPTVANLTRMIDNIAYSGGRVAQFADGGANPAASTAAVQSQIDMTIMRDLTGAVNALNALLSRGIIAVVPDSTVLDIDRRFKKINSASGGYYG